MKKFIKIFIVPVFVLICAFGFVACNDDTPPPTSPTLAKSSFFVDVQTDEGVTDYFLKWSATGSIAKYTVEYENGNITQLTTASLSLNNFASDVIHKLVFRAHETNGTQSQPVEIKFKGNKLSSPQNVRVQPQSGVMWDEVTDVATYSIQYEGITKDSGSNGWESTGEVKKILSADNYHSNSNIRNNFRTLEMNGVYEVSIQAIPYESNETFNFTETTDVLRLYFPSDLSQQSVKIEGEEMLNPTNIRWNLDNFSQNVKISWNSVSPLYKYMVSVKKPDGTSSGQSTTAGAEVGTVYFDNNFVTGNYTVGVQSQYTNVDLIDEEIYRFYIPQPIEEELSFSVNSTKLQTPQNIHLSEDNIVWNEVEFAAKYLVVISNGLNITNNFWCNSQVLSLQSVYEIFEGTLKSHGNYNDILNIQIHAQAIGPVLLSNEDNHPVFDIYQNSDYSDAASAFQIKILSIDSLQNVVLNLEGKQISWDAVSDAKEYIISFKYSDAAAASVIVSEPTYTWDNNYTVGQITIQAKKDYEVIDNDEIVIITISSINTISAGTTPPGGPKTF